MAKYVKFQVYCLKCREHVIVENPEVKEMCWQYKEKKNKKSGELKKREGSMKRFVIKGICPKCGKQVQRFINKEQFEQYSSDKEL